jgi:hypothetical protein
MNDVAPAPPSAVAAHPTKWTVAQQLVIEAEPADRLIVSAAPGTGKTAVACARVAYLAKRGIAAPNIWLLSFTRTAVREIRDRIDYYAGNPLAVAGVRISTIDSKTWQLRAGFSEDDSKKFEGGYEANIEALARMLNERHGGLVDYMDSVQHLIVDEAQDLVGVRARLVLELIRCLPRSAGVTVFADPAQAIYGFADDDEGESAEGATKDTFLRVLSSDRALAFQTFPLEEVQRTSVATLKTIFVDVRRDVLDESLAGRERFARTKAGIEANANDRLPANWMETKKLRGRGHLLILFRRRVEALRASAWLGSSGIAHRLRISGVPNYLQPWIGAMLHDWTAKTIGRDEFADRWKARTTPLTCCGYNDATAFEALRRVAGIQGDRIPLAAVRARLGRGQPPLELSLTEAGTSGPTIGTIHASKGREAQTVYLFLPKPSDSEETDWEEETRVIFVGATRARNRLNVGEAPFTPGMRLESGRTFTPLQGYRASVEIGRAHDVDIRCQVATSFFPSSEAALRNQRHLASLNGKMHQLMGMFRTHAATTERRFQYLVRSMDDPETPICALANSVNLELFGVAHALSGMRGHVRLRPDEIQHFYLAGAQTVVIHPDDPVLAEFHAPFSESGIFLAPVVTGFAHVHFRRYGYG